MDDTKQKSLERPETQNQYKPGEIESRWQAIWDKERTYQPDLDTANKPSSSQETTPFYNLMMFPYPSAEGLHVGNMYAFTGADVYGRFKRQQGHQVFEPMGLDGFGIHSENYALKIGSHPMEQVETSEKNYYRQLHSIGNGYDWTHTVETYKPGYYRWTQWVFTELFKAGLAYRAKAKVNWCPSCQTVLADEQVLQKIKGEESIGICERCDSEVEKRDLEQWFFRITGYSERLLQDLDTIDWTEKVKTAQRNWIGKSQGANVSFTVVHGEGETLGSLEVFTTRPDTLHGATFMVVSPEHQLVEKIASQITDKNIVNAVSKYVKEAQNKSERERTADGKEKTGVFSGLYAINPVNDQQIPIWIADYVLAGYGTGAIMAVPAHDQRDFDFAKKYDLPIIQVVSTTDTVEEKITLTNAFTGNGTLINSGEWDGWITPGAKKQAITWLEEKQSGSVETTYHLRDWLISRQRYWGAPIPMIYCETCAKAGKSWFTVNSHSERSEESQRSFVNTQDDKWESAGWYPEENLPVILPHIDDYRPVGTGKAPLANHPEFYETSCPACSSPARRETDVADTFLDSSWYFLRYPATDLETIPFPMKKDVSLNVLENATKPTSQGQKEVQQADDRTAWLPVTQYTGGAEHSVLHLLYARFVYKVFRDLGYIETEAGNEPFPKFFAHGLIIKEGAKMSKSKGNVVVPDLYIKKYGADTLRTYLMFLGPFSEGGDFQDAGIDGIHRFLKRIWKLLQTMKTSSTPIDASADVAMNLCIKGVTEDMSSMRYNTAIAKIMTWYNALAARDSITTEERDVLLKLLAPFAPHMTEELFQLFKSGNMKNEVGEKGSQNTFTSIHTSPWPTYNDTVLMHQSVTIAIQVNGKLRDTIVLENSDEVDQAAIEVLARKSENVQKFIEGKDVRKIIYVPGKILNIVTS